MTTIPITIQPSDIIFIKTIRITQATLFIAMMNYLELLAT